MKRKMISILLSGLMTAGLLAGCGSDGGGNSSSAADSSQTSASSSQAPAASSKDSTEEGEGASDNQEISGELNLVHYLTEDAKLQALDELVAGFNEEYPEVQVNVESTSMDNYQDVVKLKISTGDAPDIIFGGPKTYSDLVRSGNIMELSDREYTQRISENLLANVQVDGAVYGVPLDIMANVVFYNKDIFQELSLEVPTTYSEFIEVCKALDEAGYAACAAGYQDTISIGANFYTIFFGAPYLECENYAAELMSGEKSTSDYPSMAKALTQWREIMQYQNEDRKTISTDRAEQIFANGESGMIIIGTWGLGAIMNYNPDGNFGGFMYPSEETAEDNAIPLATDDTWMIVKDSPNQAAAEAFFEYMTRPEVNAKWCATTSQLSAISGVTVDTLPAAAQDIADLLDTVKVSNWISVGTFSGQYDSSFYTVCQDFAVTDDMTTDEFCEQLDGEFAAANK